MTMQALTILRSGFLKRIDMKAIAIIPARGGSKRIPGKNIRNFLGQPVIAYSIKAAITSGIFSEVMVSTDSLEISAVAKQFGAKVPFMRSADAASDFALTADVIKEVLSGYEAQGSFYDSFCCLYATAPLVSAIKLRSAYNLLLNTQVDSVMPVAKFSYPILRSIVKDSNGKIKMKWPEHMFTRSQDMEEFYHDTGQFYFSTTASFKAKGKLMTDVTLGIEMNPLEVQDIDNEDDWVLAEMKYKLLNTKAE